MCVGVRDKHTKATRLQGKARPLCLSLKKWVASFLFKNKKRKSGKSASGGQSHLPSHHCPPPKCHAKCEGEGVGNWLAWRRGEEEMRQVWWLEAWSPHASRSCPSTRPITLLHWRNNRVGVGGGGGVCGSEATIRRDGLTDHEDFLFMPDVGRGC